MGAYFFLSSSSSSSSFLSICKKNPSKLVTSFCGARPTWRMGSVSSAGVVWWCVREWGEEKKRGSRIFQMASLRADGVKSSLSLSPPILSSPILTGRTDYLAPTDRKGEEKNGDSKFGVLKY